MRPRGDHFYTTSADERLKALRDFGYVDEGVVGFVIGHAGAGTKPLFRLFNPESGDHFYTTSSSERDSAKSASGYGDEGTACWVPDEPQAPAGLVAFYRLYDAGTGDHFYTTSSEERASAKVSAAYVDEGIACWVSAKEAPGMEPLFRLYDGGTGDHFYTRSAAERDSAKANGAYQDEGIACWIYPSAGSNRTPLFRLYNPTTSDHFYTTSAAERDNAKTIGYTDEGTAGWVSAASTAAAGTTSLFRLFNPGNGDHFYTTSAAERDSAVAGGYASEGTACQVFTSSGGNPDRVPLFRLYKKYGAMVRVVLRTVQNYTLESVACLVFPGPGSGRIPLFRLYNPTSADHFYTTDPAERDSAKASSGYVDEGTACWVAATKSLGTSSFFRLFNPQSGDHFYTKSASERALAVFQSGYTDEGIACEVPISGTGTVPFFRLFNSALGDHFYTTSANERDAAIVNLGPRVGIPVMLRAMQQVYDTVGIRVVAVSTGAISVPDLLDIDVGNCIQDWPFGTTDEQDELFEHRDDAGGLDIVAYFVRSTVPALNGCAVHPAGKAGVVIASVASPWTLGHEVGHVLGLSHVNNNDRLMTGNGTGNVTNPPPDLIDEEAEEMDNSEYTIDI
jgi:hypothetical protein